MGSLLKDVDLLERAARPGEWEPLSNGRLGLSMNKESKKRPVYLSTDGKTRLCEHGEAASAISAWAAGSRARPTDNACTCCNADGLTTGRFKQPPAEWPGAPSYYDVLVARDTKEVELPGGRFARKMPKTGDGCDTFMLPCGALRCKHGNSETTLRLMAKYPDARVRKCDCVLGGRAWRRGRLQTRKMKRPF